MLTEEQVERYRTEGFLCPLRVLDDEEVLRFQGRLAELETEIGKVSRLDQGHHFFGWAYDLAIHPVIVDAVEALLGPDVLVCATLVFGKYPHDPGYVAWHQDSVYSGWHLSPSTSAWIALSPSVPENGCMRVVPGSHLDGLRRHSERPDGASLLRRGEEIEVEVDETEAHDLALQPGEMSLHHSNIIHGSNPNRSDTKRIGFIVRYVTPAYREPTKVQILRARGDSDCDHLPLASGDRPTDHLQEAVERWRQATRATSA